MSSITSNSAAVKLHRHAEFSVRAKIRSVSELGALAEQARKRQQTVVLAHGTFDLLHMGHVRHFEQARQQGDLLIVTITDDPFVNKGPDRPVFTAMLRAEMVAALAYVDWVAINPAPTAENVIPIVKPDVYVKGPDYARSEDDITGKITAERQAVEAHGGRVLFTEDIVFSSSSLLNRHFDVFKPELRGFLGALRDRDIFGSLLNVVDRIADKRVLLVGETIIDEYQYVTPLGKSPKENLIPTLYRDKEVFAGGVIASANHVAEFCREVDVVTCLGEDDSFEDIVRSALKPNVRLHAFKQPGAPTTRKCRYIDNDFFRKMFEVYFMDDNPISGHIEAQFLAAVCQLAPQADVVIVHDFGHGLLTPAIRAALLDNSKFIAVNTQSNSANMGYNLITKYKRADYICIDAPEAQLAVADKSLELARVIGEELPKRVNCDNIIVTHGRHGCITFNRNDGVHRIPAFTETAFDTMGAGDAFLAITAPMVSAGAPLELVGIIGNAAGAMKVGIVGHRRSVEKIPLLKFLVTLSK